MHGAHHMLMTLYISFIKCRCLVKFNLAEDMFDTNSIPKHHALCYPLQILICVLELQLKTVFFWIEGRPGRGVHHGECCHLPD